MADYIDRAILKKRFEKRRQWLREDVHDEYSGALLDSCESDIDLIDEIPAADVIPTPKWISVKDKLPENDEQVLAVYYFKYLSTRRFVGAMYYCPFDESPHWQYTNIGMVVTHWMPLPKLPKE